jgi:hypothetical protein
MIQLLHLIFNKETLQVSELFLLIKCNLTQKLIHTEQSINKKKHSRKRAVCHEK